MLIEFRHCNTSAKMLCIVGFPHTHHSLESHLRIFFLASARFERSDLTLRTLHFSNVNMLLATDSTEALRVKRHVRVFDLYYIEVYERDKLLDPAD